MQIAGLFSSLVWEVGESEILELQAVANFTQPNLPIQVILAVRSVSFQASVYGPHEGVEGVLSPPCCL